HLLEDVYGAVNGHRAARNLGAQRRPDQVLHHQVQFGIFRLADVVNVDDVRVVDSICGACFSQHPRAKVRFSTQVGPNEFDGDDAIDEHVPSAVDDAHAALTNAGFESVAPCDYF